MRKLITNPFLIRLSSISTLVILSVQDILSPLSGQAPLKLTADALAAGVILLLSPLSYENGGRASRAALCSGLLAILSGVTAQCWLSDDALAAVAVKILPVLVLWLVYLSFLCREKYEDLHLLFNTNAVLYSVEDYSRLFYYCIVLLLSISVLALASADCGPVWAMLMLVLSSAVYSLLYYRAYSGHTLFIGRRMERKIQDVISGNLRSSPVSEAEDAPSMSRLYARILKYMELKRPFLDPDFGLEDMAGGVLTNKSYVSRTINCFSGRNFCQFVNYYRINYAVEMVRKKPQLKVMDLAMHSGFHSVVSFNMAFRTNMNENPSEFIRRLREEKGLLRAGLSN